MRNLNKVLVNQSESLLQVSVDVCNCLWGVMVSNHAIKAFLLLLISSLMIYSSLIHYPFFPFRAYTYYHHYALLQG